MNQPTDWLAVLLMIATVLGALALRMAFEVWQFRRQTKQILATFARYAAFDPGSARRLEDMGLASAFWHIGVRDYRAETLRVLVQNGFILSTTDKRFYLSAQAQDYYTLQIRR